MLTKGWNNSGDKYSKQCDGIYKDMSGHAELCCRNLLTTYNGHENITAFIIIGYYLLGAKDFPATKEIVMQQRSIIELVNSDDIDGVRKALESGAEVNTQDNDKRNILLMATINKQKAMAQRNVRK